MQSNRFLEGSSGISRSFRTRRGFAPTIHANNLPRKHRRLCHPRAGRAPPSRALTTAPHAHQERPVRKNELHRLSFIVAVRPRKIGKILARRHPLIGVKEIGKTTSWVFSFVATVSAQPHLLYDLFKIETVTGHFVVRRKGEGRK